MNPFQSKRELERDIIYLEDALGFLDNTADRDGVYDYDVQGSSQFFVLYVMQCKVFFYFNEQCILYFVYALGEQFSSRAFLFVVLWAAPSAAGPRPLLITLTFKILVAFVSWLAWFLHCNLDRS